MASQIKLNNTTYDVRDPVFQPGRFSDAGTEALRVSHNTLVRGANLQTIYPSVANLAVAVGNGDWSRIYIGDYWPQTIVAATYNGVSFGAQTIHWTVVDIDYLYGLNTNDSYSCCNHHLVFMAAETLVNPYYHATSNSNFTKGIGGGYVYGTVLPGFDNYLTNYFGTSYLMGITPAYSSSNTLANSSAGTSNFYCGERDTSDSTAVTYRGWANGTATVSGHYSQLPSDRQIFGYSAYRGSEYDEGEIVGNRQFSLFKYCPQFVYALDAAGTGFSNYWLTCIGRGGRVSCWDSETGRVLATTAQTPRYVRPYFIFGRKLNVKS